MNFSLNPSKADEQFVKAFMASQADRPFFRFRESRNLNTDKEPVTDQRFWRALVCMRLTSRQKSGPDSAVQKLVQANPFPISIEKVRGGQPSTILRELRTVPGLRDYNVAAEQFQRNFEKLEKGLWKQTLNECNTLLGNTTQPQERKVAKYLQVFSGIGPKQARNILQALGLTKYEIPLDSRVISWLADRLQFPIPVNARLLADSSFYDFVLDAIQSLCLRCEIYPCMLDAAIFGENDSDIWTEAMMSF